MNKLPIPEKASHRIYDMLSDKTSVETKVHTSRWYAEMIIHLFLSKKTKSDISKDKFNKLFLGQKIEEIKPFWSKEIIDTLNLIKDFGDKGSHFNPDYKLTKEKTEQIVNKSIGLFSLILIDHLKKEPLNKTYQRAVVFSTLFPSIREEVLSKLINFKKIDTEYEYAILHKYVLACVKNNKSNKIKRKLSQLKKNNIIENEFYSEELRAINVIEEGMKNKELPVPITMQDCKRNFNNVVSEMEEWEVEENKQLIFIINTLLENIEESDMGDFIENKLYLV